MSANLNEFSTEQLQVLLNVVVARVVDLEENRASWEKYFHNVSGTYEENSPENCKEHEALELWRVQILNSLVEVILRETVQSN